MKKLTACISLIMAMSASATAFASEGVTTYDSAANGVTDTSTANYSTVLISKDTDAELTADDIVYIDQAESKFNGATQFLLKAQPTVGKYRITFGNADGTSETALFAIGVGEATGDLQIGALDSEEVTDENGAKYYNMSFVTSEAVELADYKEVLVKTKDGVLRYDIGVTVISGQVIFGIQIDGIPEDVKNDAAGVEVYLRPVSIDDADSEI